MSYNGTGTFNINTAGQPVVTGTTITSTAFNLLTADLATGLTTALTKDGQTTPTANIPMGSFKITGLGAGTSATDAAQYGQLQAGATTIATVTGTDTLTGSVTPALAAYATGNLFSFVAASTNTGAATINLNSLGAKNITKQGTTALIAGDIASGRVHLIEYDGTRFQLLNPASSTGTGASVFATSPTLVTPTLGVATATSLQGIIGNVTPAAGTFTTVTGSNDASINGLTVGRGAGAVSTNTTLGASALAANTTGVQHTVVGASAGASITTNGYLSAVGYQAAYYMTDSNDAFGRQALYGQSGATGYYNVGVGFRSGYSMTSGTLNTAIGNQSLYSNTSGSNSIAVGYQSLYNNTTASNSTAVGYQAGLNNNGSVGNNVFIGYQAGTNSTTGNQVILIGAGSQPSAAGSGNEIVIGTLNVTSKGGSTGFISPNGGGVYQGDNSATWSITSDQRLKKNIVDNNIGLSAINAIKVRNFEYRTADEITDLPKLNVIAITGVQLGVIAQELQAVLPDCVKTESTGVMSVKSDNLTWYMINAIKELKAEFDAYKASHP